MNGIVIRDIIGDERLDVMYRLPSYAFRPTPPMPDPVPIREMIARRTGTICLGAELNGEIVATVASAPMTQNVRGRILGMGGIFWVVTQPQARRKGFCKALMKELFAAIRSENRPVSCLYPFRESFYERMGYVTFPQMKKATLHPMNLLPILDMNHNGFVELKLLSDCFDDVKAYLGEIQTLTHGMAFFEFIDSSPESLNKVWAAIAHVDGRICGMMIYQLKGDHPTEFTMIVNRFYYHTNQGRYLLLDWIARHTDQAISVEITLPSSELPETWIADLNVQIERFYVPPMGRVIDVSGLNGIEVGPGSISVEVRDLLCPWNEGIWRLKSVDGRLHVESADSADCVLDIRGLSALVFGTHDYGDFELRGWGQLTLEQVNHLSEMFPRKLPYIHAFF